MEKLELLNIEDFDMSIQGPICDADSCEYDCAPDSKGYCSAAFTGLL
ncbi:hypothetical protein ACYCS5_10525 [Paenibacillus sp. SEL3]|nr:hypothetical protein [Paenibacillus polymyxa]MCH6189040.1 hypothetical protein [Paenibacillus polymyxa]MDY8095775.1 hypothetical protein [Paenibacillus polymyxa]WRL57866.1 hypothetical protein U3G77_06205 [Paenibacillus polymyxa]